MQDRLPAEFLVSQVTKARKAGVIAAFAGVLYTDMRWAQSCHPH